MRKISTRTRKSMISNYRKAAAAKAHDDDTGPGMTKTSLKGVRRARAANRLRLSSAAASIGGRPEGIRKMH